LSGPPNLRDYLPINGIPGTGAFEWWTFESFPGSGVNPKLEVGKTGILRKVKRGGREMHGCSFYMTGYMSNGERGVKSKISKNFATIESRRKSIKEEKKFWQFKMEIG